jgi:hypothetical protein
MLMTNNLVRPGKRGFIVRHQIRARNTKKVRSTTGIRTMFEVPGVPPTRDGTGFLEKGIRIRWLQVSLDKREFS